MKINIYKDMMKQGILSGLFFILLVILGTSTGLAQKNTVNGTVTDAQTGKPLPSVNILVVGTSTGTATDAEGHYSLDVPPMQDTLRFSFIGYKTQTIPIKGRSTINVSMKPAIISGKELVVVGFGTQRQENLTGAVASVSGEDIKSLPISNFKGAIAGKMAGVQINSVNGRPGGGETIRIRGIGSIGAGNNPLVVVDGFPRSAVNLPPNQIKSIDVLKGPAATAIYGSRGANGVVLITTKKPTSELKVQINSSVGYQKVRWRGMVNVLNARQFAQFKKERISDYIRFYKDREPTPQDIPEMYRSPEQYGEGTDWPDLLLDPAFMTNQSISIGGGTETVKGLLSLSYLNQPGTLMGTGYKRYNLRAEINAKLSKKLNVGLTIAPSLAYSNYSGTGGGRGGPYPSSFLLNPIIPFHQPDGSLTGMITGPGILGWPNPVKRIKLYYSNVKHRRRSTIVSAFGEYEIIKGLELKSSFNVDWRNRRAKSFHPSTLGSAFNIEPPTISYGTYNTRKTVNWQSRNTLHYKTDIRNHSVQALLGFTVQNSRTEFANFEGRDYPDNSIHTLNVASTITGNTHATEWGLVSYLARVNYDYKNRYLLTATIRRDGSSRFGSQNKWGIFPSISVGWRISNEKFMENVEMINGLKLRVGYGKSGNFSIGNYTHLGTVSLANYILNGQLVSGRSITNLGNINLGWETSYQFNVGLDIRMLHNRLNITADFYREVTSGMLLNIDIPYTSGFRSSITNRGEIMNKGIELAIKATIVDNSLLTWNINFNIAHNSIEVTELNSPIFTPTSTAQHITKEGYAPGLFYGYVVKGFFKNEEQIKNAPHQPNAIPGSYIYKDVNGDGRIDPIQDFGIIGNPYPDFTGGLTSSLNYKNFDFRITMTATYGNQVLVTGREDFWNLDGVFNISAMALNRWRSPEHPGAGLIPRAISNVVHRFNQSTWVVDGSNLWIRNIALGYTFSADQQGFLNSLGVNNMRIYFNVQNPWLSNGKLQNPAVSLKPNDPLQPGETRNSSYPISKTFTLGININL